MSRQSSARSSEYFQNIIDKPIKLDKWDTTGVKHGLDDVIKKLFNKGLNFKETNELTNAKIFMSATAVMLALLAFVYDYFTGFPKSFPILLLCVVGYVLLMSALYLFSLVFEKTYVYSGIKRDPSGFLTDCRVNVATVLKRFDHNYTVTITCVDSADKVVRTQSESGSLADWFDSKGNLGVEIFGMFINKLYSKVKVNQS